MKNKFISIVITILSTSCISKTKGVSSKKKELIQKSMRAGNKDFTKCYNDVLKNGVNVEGKVTLKFVINRNGKPESVNVHRTTLNNETVENCMIEKALKLEFPKFNKKGTTTVFYPFIFSTRKL